MNDANWYTDKDGTMHDQWKVSIFADGQYWGSFIYDPGNYPGLGWNRQSIAFFCPSCGDTWGRLAYEGRHKAPWRVESVACRKHYDQWNIPGSILSARMDELLPLLPDMAVAREFQLHLAHCEREHYGEDQREGSKAAAA